MAIISTAATLAGVMRLLEAGGTPSRADLIKVMIAGHFAGAQLTDLDSEPVNWTYHGRALMAHDEVEQERLARLREQYA